MPTNLTTMPQNFMSTGSELVEINSYFNKIIMKTLDTEVEGAHFLAQEMTCEIQTTC